MENIEDNGHNHDASVDALDEAEKVAFQELGAKQRGDASIASVARMKLGVIATTLTPPEKDAQESEYRKALIIADFMSPEEAFEAIAAIEERRLCGVSISPIIDSMLALCAVNRRGQHTNRVAQALDAISHTTFTTNAGKYAGTKNNSRNTISQ